MTTNRAQSKILPLTSARFFAAVYVVIYHGTSHDGPDLFSRIVSLGYVSVSFFFMLSGFILAIVYLKDDEPVNRRRFFISRFARIYPLYFAALLLDLPHFLHWQRDMVHATTGHTITAIVATGGLAQAWFPSLGGLNVPSWSLSAEAFFYLLFPFVGVALWRLRIRSMLWVSGVIYLCGILLVRVLDTMQDGAGRQSYHPFPHLFVFLLGINLAKLFVWIGHSPERSAVLRRFGVWMLLGSAILFLAIPSFNLPIPESQIQHGLLVPLFALAILAFASGNQIISSVFSAGWLVILGEASYALYLIHVPIDLMFRRLIERYGTPMFFVYVGATIGLSVISLKWLETPARYWILNRERVRSPETNVTGALSQ